MRGDHVDLLHRMGEDRAFPFPERGHASAGRATGHQCQIRIDHPHRPRGLHCDPTIFVSGLVAHLPRPVHLVAEAPDLHPVGLFGAVGATHFGEVRILRHVAVLDEIHRRLDAAGAEVHGHHRLDVGLLRPRHELVGADLVRLEAVPREIETLRALVDWPDAVLPAIAGDEIAAGVADRRNAHLTDEVDHVLTKAFLVGGLMAGLVDASVDGASEVFHEGSERAAPDGADDEGRVDLDVCFHLSLQIVQLHCGKLPERVSGRRTQARLVLRDSPCGDRSDPKHAPAALWIP